MLRRFLKWFFGRPTPIGGGISSADSPVSENPDDGPVAPSAPSWHKYGTPQKPMPGARQPLSEEGLTDGLALRLVDLVNESLDIAKNSADAGTRISRLKFAEEKLLEVQALAAVNPRIKIQHLAGVKAEIERLKPNFTAAVSFTAEELMRSQGALAEVNGKPTYALANMKDDLQVMAACVKAEAENYWRQPEGHRLIAAPSFFLRAAILSRKAKDYAAEVAFCQEWLKIVKDYKSQDSVTNGISAKVWLGPTSRKIEERLPKAKEMLSRKNKVGGRRKS